MTTSMPGNPHATEDALYTEDSNNASTVNATLALAFEQRTANLLAYRRMTGEIIASRGGRVDQRTMEKLAAVDEQMEKGLGLWQPSDS
jgi:hypothetical protein